jgi:hypothetical protein
MLHMLVVRRTYRVYIAFIPMYADVHIRVDIAQKKVNVFITEVHPFTIEVVYTYILYAKAHLTQKGQNPRFSKSSPSTGSSSSTKYIFILEL